MDIKKETTVTMNVNEASVILKEWVEKHKGVKVDSIVFNIGSHNQEDDWRSEFPLEHRLDSITIKGTEK